MTILIIVGIIVLLGIIFASMYNSLVKSSCHNSSIYLSYLFFR